MAEHTLNSDTECLLDQISKISGCHHVRQLEDGTVVGVGQLLYTTALYVGLTIDTWHHRFCFDDPALALSELQRLRTAQDEPIGWIARRPQQDS